MVILRELLILIILAVATSLAYIAIHPDFSWIAEPSLPTACELPNGVETRVFAALQRISPAFAQTFVGQEHVTFIDARTPHQYATSHIPGAINIPAEDAANLLSLQSLAIPVDQQIIVYCEGGSCERSEYLGKLLSNEVGCSQVSLLEGGWTAWGENQGPEEGEHLAAIR